MMNILQKIKQNNNIEHSPLYILVKLDPPDLKNVSMKKHGKSVTVHWTRTDRFSDSMETIREIQYKHSFATVRSQRIYSNHMA